MHSEVEKIIGYSFSDKDLLNRALTHASIEGENYERLEFLGDRVLGLVVAEIIFKKYPKEKEGELARRFSALVRGQTLAQIGKEIAIDKHVLQIDSSDSPKGTDNEHIIADVIEALLGAMYIDGGEAPCKAMIEKYWNNYFETMTEPPRDPKTELQEWAQARGKGTPKYEIIDQTGPAHAPIFTIQATIQGLSPTTAIASNRRKAEKDAAREMLKAIKKET